MFSSTHFHRSCHTAGTTNQTQFASPGPSNCWSARNPAGRVVCGSWYGVFCCCCVPSYLRHMPPARRDGKHPNRANERASERTNSRPDGKSCQYHNRKQTIMSSLWSVCVFASLVSLPQWFPSTYTLPPTYNYNFVIFFYQPFARKLNSLLRKGLFKKKAFFYFVFSATVYARALLHHLPRPQRATTDDTPLCASFHF